MDQPALVADPAETTSLPDTVSSAPPPPASPDPAAEARTHLDAVRAELATARSLVNDLRAMRAAPPKPGAGSPARAMPAHSDDDAPSPLAAAREAATTGRRAPLVTYLRLKRLAAD